MKKKNDNNNNYKNKKITISYINISYIIGCIVDIYIYKKSYRKKKIQGIMTELMDKTKSKKSEKDEIKKTEREFIFFFLLFLLRKSQIIQVPNLI